MWIEEYLFYPKTTLQKIVSFVFLPFTFLYCLIVYFKFPKTKKEMGIPIISIGNLIVGGSGKTPLSIFLANNFDKGVVVLRGYGRKSKGTILVSKWGEILVDVNQSGDEAQEIAQKTSACVIVSENREDGINLGKKLGGKFVILDDGFDKGFKKLSIVIDVKIKNNFCLPSGGYRYPRSFLKYSDIILEEGKNFVRDVNIPKCDNCVLISGISKPERLLEYVKTDKYHFFIDHYEYKKEELQKLLEKYNCDTILTTYKDYVKMKNFGLKIKVIELNLKIDNEVIDRISNYIGIPKRI